MGWKSTIDITREEALAKLGQVNFYELTNDELAGVLESALGEDHGYNYRIVGEIWDETKNT